MAQIAVVQLLAPVAEIVRQAPTNTLIRAYVGAARELCNRSRWLRNRILGPTVAAQKRYNLGSDTYEEVIGIAGMSVNDGSRWIPVTEGNVANEDGEATAGLPEVYEYVPHGQFSVWPLPDGAYDVDVTAVIQPKLGVITIDDSLTINWEDALKAGALYRLLRIKGQPWSDPAESAVQYQLFMSGVYAAQSDVAAGFNAGAASTNRNGAPNNRLRGRILPI